MASGTIEKAKGVARCTTMTRVGESAELENFSPRELLAAAKIECSSTGGLNDNIGRVRARIFRMSELARIRGEPATSREICALAWSLAPEDLEAGQPSNYDLLSSEKVRGAVSAIASEKTVVFVTGCGRSGTSLQQRCLSTVRNPVYFWSENPITRIFREWPAQGDVLVLKRTALCHQYFDLVPAKVKIVHMVRHPYAAITSTHPRVKGYYLSVDRWVSEFRAFCRLEQQHPAQNLIVSRYEDLVTAPDDVQGRIGTKFGLEFDMPFRNYVRRNYLDRKIEKTGLPRVWEPIGERRATDRRVLLSQHKVRLSEFHRLADPEIRDFCRRFEYELD